MSSRQVLRGGTLVICEKPEAARRVAEALSANVPEAFRVVGVEAFRLEDVHGRRYVVCAAAGHLYGISDTVRNRRVYPVADLEWFPLRARGGRGGGLAESRIRAIRSLSREADAFINACDFDVEGETIGYNILRYACGGEHLSARRARFSSLTKDEIAAAFGEEALLRDGRLAVAGRLRHVVDFLWGVNLSRALSEALRTGGEFRTISIGRVQGPTLNFVVDREVAVRTFVPTPYWTARARVTKDGLTFEARCTSPTSIGTERAAREVRSSSEGRDGEVTDVSRRTVSRAPPPPFNLADLQREAFAVLGYTPSETLRLAERLYLGAVISYPRTGSQRLPRLDYEALLSRLAAIPEYSREAGKVLAKGEIRPVEGRGVDSAHPAIYPTGEPAKRPLAGKEKALFDLVVRRFISCFGEAAVSEVVSADILVGTNRFGVEVTNLLVPGWMELAMRHPAAEHEAVPPLQKGDKVHVATVRVEENLRGAPPRYDQSTLLEKMEREGIGTKATRAETISTLLERGYLSGESLVPTELGFVLIETMQERCPKIISTELTRDVEAELERIEESGEASPEFFEATLSALMAQLEDVRRHEGEISDRMRGSYQEPPNRAFLGRCPVCKEGRLWVVRSHKTGKRFVGCTNYSKGCSASAPLPQLGAIRVGAKSCESCGWPVVQARLRGRTRRLCVNQLCPRKVNVYAMRGLQRKGLK